MHSNKIVLSLLLTASVLAGACIFQNDPVKPNVPPEITAYSPLQNLLTIEAPADKVVFSIEASDGDMDELRYMYLMADTCSSTMDSILGETSSVEFEAVNGGIYCIQGRVYDGSSYVSRNWYITVIEESNEPPRIVSIIPDIDSLSCLIGNSVDFDLGVWDDKPQYLRYTYLIDDVPKKVLSQSSAFDYRFFENGHFKVTGIVWDWEFGDTVDWYINVIGDPDYIPPDPIIDLEGWTGDISGSVILRWTAPGDDGDEGRCQSYKVRTATIPIITEQNWHEASEKFGTPEPGMAGTIETMTAVNCYPGTFLYATVRAVDDFGNLGPMGNCISLLVRGFDIGGRVIDGETGLPVDGAVVSAGMIEDVTDIHGNYSLPNLPKYSQLVRVRDEQTQDIGQYYDLAVNLPELGSHSVLNLTMMSAAPTVSQNENRYSDFLDFLEEMTDTEGFPNPNTIYAGWNHWPLKTYNPPMVYNDVDLREVARGSMDAWEIGTGLELFVEVDDPAEADWEIIYYEDSTEKHKVKVIELNEDGTPRKKEMWIFLDNTLSPIAIQGHMIYAHELGHVIGMKHSLDTGHLMIGMTTPYVKDPSEDELRLVKIIYNMPTFFNSRWFLRE